VYKTRTRISNLKLLETCH